MNSAKIEVVRFDAQDVITTSGEGGGGGKTYNYLYTSRNMTIMLDQTQGRFVGGQIFQTDPNTAIVGGWSISYDEKAGKYLLNGGTAPLPDDGNVYEGINIYNSPNFETESGILAWLADATNGFKEVQ